MVVDRDEDHDEEDGEDGERSRRDFEGADVGVHGGRLLDGESGELSKTAVEHYSGHEDWEDPYNYLGIFYLLCGAMQSLIHLYYCSVKDPDAAFIIGWPGLLMLMITA